MAGRKPKPTAIKELEGNPGKRKLNKNEPKPEKGMHVCPEWLLPEAKAEWKRLSEKLNQMGVLTEVDIAAFAAYCQSYARWKEAQERQMVEMSPALLKRSKIMGATKRIVNYGNAGIIRCFLQKLVVSMAFLYRDLCLMKFILSRTDNYMMY